MAPYDLTTEEGVLEYLQNGRFSNSVSATRLSGGYSAFVYRVETSSPLPSGASSFILKHVLGHAARSPAFKLDEARLDFEHRALSDLPAVLDLPEGPDRVNVPSVIHFDQTAHVLIIEDIGRVPTLKAWLTPSVSTDECKQIGRSLGRFLAAVHSVPVDHPSNLFEYFDDNTTAKQLSALVYYGNLTAAAARFGITNEHITAAAEEAKREVLETKEVLTLGDFWPGNVLVSPASSEDSTRDGREHSPPALKLYALDLELAKPGTRAFDIGQMAAELYCLARYRDPTKGTVLLDTFLGEYKKASGIDIDVAKFAIRVGAHLVVIGPMGWTPQDGQVTLEDLVAEGARLVEAGWKRDEAVLKASMLSVLFD